MSDIQIKKNHKCDICSKLFRKKSDLVRHKIIHTNEKNHICDVCAKLFRRKSNLVEHTKIHKNEKNHKCDVCSKLFRRKDNLVRHKKIHTDEKKSYQCFECGKNFTYRDGIIKHVQLHKKRPFKCDKCKIFISAVQLKNHYKVHNKEKLFPCNLCAESFVEIGKLKSHVKHIHNDTERDVILQPYNNSVSLGEDKSKCCKDSGMKSCYVVSERFQRKFHDNNVVHDMYETSNLALSTTSKSNDEDTNEKNHKCDVCSKLFRRKFHLVEHKKIHTNERKHKCDVCSMLFRRKFTLLQHKVIHTNEKKHKCDVCSKLFRTKTDLVQHKEIHTNEKSHKCDVCSKLFRRKSYLVQHKKIHMNEKKNYQCFECGKNLTSREGIRKHLQLHKKCPFKCDKCKKVFISAVQLKNHYKVHNKKKLFSCNLCAESFVEKRKLQSHVKHIHNGTERDVILQPYNNSVSLHEAKSECSKESGMKSCYVVLERFQTENNVMYDMMGIHSSETADNVPVMEVKAELEESPSSESKPFNVSIIYKEEEFEESKPFNPSIIYNEEDVEESKPFNPSIIYNEEDVEESKPFNASIIYNEEDVEDGTSLTNGCVISSAID